MSKREKRLLRASVKALQDNAAAMKRLSKILLMYVEDHQPDDDEGGGDEPLHPDHPGQGKPRRAGIIKHGDVLIPQKPETPPEHERFYV